MITGSLKQDIDALWLEFWQGGIANPLTVIEQITYLMFVRLHLVGQLYTLLSKESRIPMSGQAGATEIEVTQKEFIDAVQAELADHFRWSSLESLVEFEAGSIAGGAFQRVIDGQASHKTE